MSEITLFLVRLGILLIVAHGVGYIFSTYLKLPRVLGEMGVGILLSYNLLGKLPILYGEVLFSPEIIAQPTFHFLINMATIILLFNAGMHTDIRFFLKFFLKGSLIGLAGIITSFIVAVVLVRLFVPSVTSVMHPIAIFMGIATSTSVGISARILSDKNSLNTLEGNISITAAILDDVLGIIFLAGATSIAYAFLNGEDTNIASLVFLAGKEVLVWAVLTVGGVILAKILARYLRILTPFTAIGMTAIGFVLLMGGFAEYMGLSMVIGAYILGLGFSSIDTSIEIQERINDLSGFFVPVFFVLTGIQIDFVSMQAGILFSIIYAIGTMAIKMMACGAMAGLCGFNARGMARIGAIMLPRGEVTIIIANIGLGLGILTKDLFGTLAFTVFLSILLTPIMLNITFRSNKSGYKKPILLDDSLVTFCLDSLTDITQSYLFNKILDTFQKSGYFVYSLDLSRKLYQFRKKGVGVVMRKTESAIVFSTQHSNVQLIKLIIVEEMADMQLELKDLQESSDGLKNIQLEKSLLSGLVQGNIEGEKP